MGEKILIIDDEADIVEALRLFLTKKGYNVLGTTSVIKGIAMIETEKPKVVFLDIRMPEMSGVEAVKKIREIDKEIGIIMATAVLDEDIARKTIELGASDYIIKPLNLSYLEKSLIVKLSMLT